MQILLKYLGIYIAKYFTLYNDLLINITIGMKLKEKYQ